MVMEQGTVWDVLAKYMQGLLWPVTLLKSMYVFGT